jgi:hypothetical protein
MAGDSCAAAFQSSQTYAPQEAEPNALAVSLARPPKHRLTCRYVRFALVATELTRRGNSPLCADFVAKGSRETRKSAQALKVFYCRLLPRGIGG